MRLRVHHSLFAGYLGVTGVLVALLVLLVGNGLRREFDQLYREDLGRQLGLAAALVEATTTASPDTLARLITERIGNRVTIIRPDGVVLGDSYVDPGRLSAVENHLGRPEVQGVLSGESMSFTERTSATVGDSLLYGARMATLDGEPVVLRIAAPRTEIERAVGAVQRTVTLTGLLTMLLALAAAYGVSRAFTRPLVQLADRARRLTRGDFSGRVPLGRVAELQDLAAAFNRLAEELQARLSDLGRERDEMQTLIDCMAEGVVALTDGGKLLRVNRAARVMLDLGESHTSAPIASVVREGDLRSVLERSVTVPAQSAEIEIGGRHLLVASRALDSGGAVTTLLDISELRRLEQVRRDFVANASHELKTPLTSIRGFAETLVDDDPPEPLRQRFLDSIRANTLRLQRLVDDLLDLSRLESGGWAADRAEVDVGAVVVEAWELLTERSDQAPAFTVVGDAVVVGDRDGLHQVFRNLLENALRHTDPSEHIRVEIEIDQAAGLARISVIDDGEGIPLRVLPRVFERFFRADSSRARDAGGTGLGLAIVKHLVVSMGGAIEAHSALGRGTTVTFTVPVPH